MPVEPFIKLFEQWGENSGLLLKRLRLKTVTLTALMCMTKLSDLAPKGVISSCSEDLNTSLIVLSLDNIDFCEDCSVTIHFWRIKSDSTWSGFEVNIPPNTNCNLDPVKCLKDYIDRKKDMGPCDTKPLFIETAIQGIKIGHHRSYIGRKNFIGWIK